MTSLSAPNATHAERALEGASGRILDVPVPLATLWNPTTCPATHLPWLAFAVSVDTWDERWTEAQKRQVIRDSVQVHRLKGTRGSVERALSGLGFRIDISEWFEHSGAVHTFRLEAYADDVFAAGLSVDARLLDTVTKVIAATKPVRSHFELRIGETFWTAAVMRTGIRARFEARFDAHPQTPADAGTSAAVIRHGFRHRRISRHTHLITPTEGAPYAA